ncbi:MAG: VTT domain-containing protein [Acidobacteriota bacterium]
MSPKDPPHHRRRPRPAVTDTDWIGGRKTAWRRLAGTLFVFIALWGLIAIDPPGWQTGVEALGSGGIAGRLLFVAAFACGTVLAVPGLLLMALGVTAFGPLEGFLLSSAGGTFGAAGAFAIARWVIRQPFADRRNQRPRWRWLAEGLERHGAVAVLLLRLLPLMPFNLSNYLCGVTSIRFGSFLWATAVGILPGAYVYCQVIAGLSAATKAEPAGSGLFWSLTLLVFLLVVLPRLAGGSLRKVFGDGA